MDPMDVKRKALHAVKAFGRNGIAEHLKEGYGKPALVIDIKSVRAMPEHGGMSEEAEGEGKLSPKDLAMHEQGEGAEQMKAEGEYGAEEAGEGMHKMPDGSKMMDSEMKGGKPEITPELLEMLLSKLRK